MLHIAINNDPLYTKLYVQIVDLKIFPETRMIKDKIWIKKYKQFFIFFFQWNSDYSLNDTVLDTHNRIIKSNSDFSSSIPENILQQKSQDRCKVNVLYIG